MFKIAANDGSQGVPYGKTFGRGDNITAIRHSLKELEFAVNGKSQGRITLQKPMPADVVGENENKSRRSIISKHTHIHTFSLSLSLSRALSFSVCAPMYERVFVLLRVLACVIYPNLIRLPTRF